MAEKQFTVILNDDGIVHTGADSMDFTNGGTLINLTKDGVIKAVVPGCNVKYILWEELGEK